MKKKLWIAVGILGFVILVASLTGGLLRAVDIFFPLPYQNTFTDAAGHPTFACVDGVLGWVEAMCRRPSDGSEVQCENLTCVHTHDL